MKKYNEFINENIKDLLKPKSDEDIMTYLNSMDIFKRLKKIHRLELPKKYLPSNDEIIEAIKLFSNNDKIKFIIIYGLDFDLLPRNEKGICYFNGDLNIIQNGVEKLPDNFMVDGSLYIKQNELIELPKNLIIKGHLDCSYNEIKSINFNELHLGGYLKASSNEIEDITGNINIKGDLNLSDNKLSKLIDNITVEQNFYCSYNLLTELPKGLKIGEDFKCIDNKVILKLPEDAQIGKNFINVI